MNTAEFSRSSPRWSGRGPRCLVLGLLALGAIGEIILAESGTGGETVGCAHCHDAEGREFAGSVHAAAAMECQSCHGGPSGYPISMVTKARVQRHGQVSATGPAGTAEFDHGPTFRGKPARLDVPERCGTCHSDVARMNPYGLSTDQWAQYRLSGHGRALYEEGNDGVAVCTDCHGKHAILRPKDPASAVYPTNVPATCRRCHADPEVMAGSGLSTRVVAEYRESVHGHGLLEKADTGMPSCATCHGSHSAVPPGFRDVGHVCGRCHQQEEQRFLEGFHGRFEDFPRCVVCHTRRVDLRDHLIERIVITPEAMEETYAKVVTTMPAAPLGEPAQEAFAALRPRPVERFGAFCGRCHHPSRQVAHRAFFGDVDERAVRIGDEIYRLVQHAEFQYAATAHRVSQMQRGVLLVKDEALMLEELRTQVVGLAVLQHAFNLEKINEAVAAQDELAAQIHRSLDDKLRGLRWRYWGLVPMWTFLTIFSSVLWIKYKRLKAALVTPLSPH